MAEDSFNKALASARSAKGKAADLQGKFDKILARAQSKYNQRVKAERDAIAKYEKERKAYLDELSKLQSEMSSAFNEARTAYQGLVKKSNGLTSVKPSVIKPLEKLRDTGDPKYAKEAIKALEKHKAEVVKAGGKNDPTVKAFAAGIDGFIKGLS